MYPNPYAFYRTGTDSQLLKDIEKAVNAEYSAVACYKKMAKMASDPEERKRILEIRRDEMRHLAEFTAIYARLTGKQPSYQMTEECPDEYREAVDYAFKDEQGAVDFYLDIADNAQDPMTKDRFRRAAADEQNHAVWFLSFIKHTDARPAHRQLEDYGARGALNASSLTFPQMLTYAIQDEYLAQARYDDVLATFGNVRTFMQIKEAEMRHINALQPLFQRYQVLVPEDAAASYVTTPENLKAAYAAGVQGEIDNIAMYDRFLSLTIPQDARIVFTQLRNASLNHLAAFERGLARD
ncbi:ferritin family protein [Halobacillus litoralis]|uniref:ferritin family protein n=1 Tax=Halobacillus litoralis TaxID=45668 RepID=UPI001CD1B954|nr:ferritin family protein [Halobacillus litoralis]MCA1020571.1 ferritin-like domain-containing protein [Halobacillus litoralis]